MHFDPINPTLIAHDFVKSIYTSLLEMFPEDEIVDFWNRNPVTMHGKLLSTSDLLKLLWMEKANVPLAWDYAVGEAVEPVLATKGIGILDFYQRMLFRINQSTFVPGRLILGWIYPVLRTVFHADPRDLIINLIPYWTESLYAKHIHRRVKRVERGNFIESVLVYITDHTFRETIYFDLEIQCGEQVRAGPKILGLPEFEEVGVLADCRSIKKILWKENIEIEGDVLRIDGQAAGRRIDFGIFCQHQEIDLKKFRVPEKTVILMEMDWICPQRKRVVLHAGAVYESPVYLQTIRHKCLPEARGNLLEHIVGDLAEENRYFGMELEAKHKRILSALENTMVFVFREQDESMTLDGEHLIKGVPARILRKLLAAYLSDGQAEFEYRLFKKDFEISLGQKNSNFEVRFKRLTEKMAERCPDLRIEKRGRGRFAILVKRSFRLQQE